MTAAGSGCAPGPSSDRSAPPRVPIGADAGRLFDPRGTVFRSARDVAAPDRGRSERSSPVLAGKRYPTERPAVERPGFLNRDWRSGYADSNPLWLDGQRALGRGAPDRQPMTSACRASRPGKRGRKPRDTTGIAAPRPLGGRSLSYTPVDSLGPIARGPAYSGRYPGRQRRRPSPRHRWVGVHDKTFGVSSDVHLRYGRPARGTAERLFTSKASTASLPPSPLRLLPAGANQLPGGSFTR